MKKIYLAFDEAENQMIGNAHETEAGAREELLNFLMRDTGYLPEDWQEWTEEYGYKTPEELQDAIRQISDYDDAFNVSIHEAFLTL